MSTAPLPCELCGMPGSIDHKVAGAECLEIKLLRAHQRQLRDVADVLIEAGHCDPNLPAAEIVRDIVSELSDVKALDKWQGCNDDREWMMESCGGVFVCTLIARYEDERFFNGQYPETTRAEAAKWTQDNSTPAAKEPADLLCAALKALCLPPGSTLEQIQERHEIARNSAARWADTSEKIAALVRGADPLFPHARNGTQASSDELGAYQDIRRTIEIPLSPEVEDSFSFADFLREDAESV